MPELPEVWGWMSMGKIRIKTLGEEDKEKEEKKKAKQRAEAKKAEKESAEPEKTEAPSEKTQKKQKKYKAGDKKQSHSQSYISVLAQVDRVKKYLLDEALALLPKLKRAKFDETVELHVNTHETGVSGNLVLPHGTGKKLRIEILNPNEDLKHLEEVVREIEKGILNFDVLIATPDAMPKIARVAKILGPRGLMPNPKSGTVTTKPADVAKKYEGGQVNFKTELKSPIIHLTVGKVSFGQEKLAENIKAVIAAIQIKNIKDITLKSTMSPGIKLDTTSI